MSNLDSLKNSGLLSLNKPEISCREKTVVVLGPARGGTTMVASVLQALGVYMGERLGRVLEDLELSDAVESGNSDRVKKLVRERNASYAVWGWKRPSALDHIGVWRKCFRNLYLIAIFRDPFVIANRNRISMLSDVFENMTASADQLRNLIQFLSKEKRPVLMCSYEKVLAAPDAFVKEIDGFLSLDVPRLWPTAIKQITPSPDWYLESSRITQSIGHLDVANERICGGWAFYPKLPNVPAKVILCVNGDRVGTVEARRPREDVKKKGVHPTGLCGFSLKWPNHVVPRVGDWVAAQVEGDVKALSGSPKQVSAVSIENVVGDVSEPVGDPTRDGNKPD